MGLAGRIPMTIRQAYEAIARGELRKHDIHATEASMEFDEWWHEHGSGIAPVPGYDMEEHANVVARFAWEAATAAERERCAGLIEEAWKNKTVEWIPVVFYEDLRRDIAAEIRRKP